MYSTKENPALAPFDISDYKGVENTNFYKDDSLLQDIVKKYSTDCEKKHQDEIQRHLEDYGRLAGSILNVLVEACHKEGKWGEHIPFDRTGKRIDKIQYCPEQEEVRRINYEYGIVNLDFHSAWKYPFTETHRMALAYLANTNGEGGITCPLAMTDGMIRALKALGNEKQKEKYLSLVAGEKSSSHFMAGQYITERVGGSNVSENRTVAHKLTNGKWTLKGEKWFCSNPGDLWVTTARIKDTSRIGMFLIPKKKENGEQNSYQILRKKDIIGSKGKLTVEVIYEDVEAEELGRPDHGLANLIQYIIQTSRIHVSLASCGFSRRAFMEARAYTKIRKAYGKRVIDFLSVQEILTEMQILHSSVLWCAFKNISFWEKKSKLSLLLTPLLKYISTTTSTWITHKAILLHGGNGIIDNFSCLPRLHNDSIINETWEGTHQIVGEHVLKAFFKTQIANLYFEHMEENTKKLQGDANHQFAYEILKIEIKELKNILEENKRSDLKRQVLKLCDKIFYTWALSEWLTEAKESKNNIISYFALGLAEIVNAKKGIWSSGQGIFGNTEKMSQLIDY